MNHTVTPTRVATGVGLGAGFAGFLVGGAYAAAQNLHKVKNGEMERNEAITDTLKEGGKTGLATGGAALLTGVLGLPSLLGAATFMAAGCGIKYWLDNMGKNCGTKTTVEAETPKSISPKDAKAEKKATVQ